MGQSPHLVTTLWREIGVKFSELMMLGAIAQTDTKKRTEAIVEETKRGNIGRIKADVGRLR